MRVDRPSLGNWHAADAQRLASSGSAGKAEHRFGWLAGTLSLVIRPHAGETEVGVAGDAEMKTMEIKLRRFAVAAFPERAHWRTVMRNGKGFPVMHGSGEEMNVHAR